MADQTKLQILISAKDDASAVLDKVSERTQDMSRQFKIAGAAITAAGVAIVAALGMCVKAAAAEEAGMVRLRVAAENVGIAYDEVEESLERWIDTMQQKTSVADDEQRESLASLIRITRDVAEAQDLLTLAMDVAVGTGRDLASATTLLMYALSGNWGMLERYIPAIKEAADEEEKWLMLRELFAGQAEEYGKTLDGQMKLLSHNIGDVKEAIGMVLIPIVTKVVSAFSDFIQRIKELNPEFLKIGVIATAAAGALALIMGPILLLLGYLPVLRSGFHALTAAIHRTTTAVVGLRTALLSLSATLAAVAGLVGVLVMESDALISTETELHNAVWLLANRLEDLTDAQRESAIATIEAAIEAGTLTDAQYALVEGVLNVVEAEEELIKIEGELNESLVSLETITAEARDITRFYAEALIGAGEAAAYAADQLGDYLVAVAAAGVAEALTEDALDDYIRAIKEFGPRSDEARDALVAYVDTVAGARDVQLEVEEALRGLDEQMSIVTDDVDEATDSWRKHADAIGSAADAYDRLMLEAGAVPAPGLPSYQYGGVVPGPIGVPQLVMAHGGERFLGAGAGETYNDNTHLEFHVSAVIREEADIDKVARELYNMYRRSARAKGISPW